jgi:hypothetical protein
MRKQLMTAAAVLLISAAAAPAQTARSTPRPDDETSRQKASFTPALVGAWKSVPDQMKLTSDFDKSVWGADTSSVRTVDLTVQPSGDATLRITKKVVDARGRTVPASTWIEEANLVIGDAREGIATRVEHDTTVKSAVRLFPDDKDYKWPIEGLRVKVVTFTGQPGDSIEIRYDTPDGRGSFWETLRREGAGAGRTAR